MKRGKLLVLPAMGWLTLFFALPLLIVVGVSFASRTAYGQVVFQWTLTNYTRFLEPLYLMIFVSTLATALITTLFTFAMGYPVAYTIAMVLPKKWQQAGIILVMIPFWINFLIRSYSWVIILRAQGLVNTFLLHLGVIQVPMTLLYNNYAVMLGMVYALLPFMVLPIYVSLEQMDKPVTWGPLPSPLFVRSPCLSPCRGWPPVPSWCSFPPWGCSWCRTLWEVPKAP